MYTVNFIAIAVTTKTFVLLRGFLSFSVRRMSVDNVEKHEYKSICKYSSIACVCDSSIERYRTQIFLFYHIYTYIMYKNVICFPITNYDQITPLAGSLLRKTLDYTVVVFSELRVSKKMNNC